MMTLGCYRPDPRLLERLPSSDHLPSGPRPKPRLVKARGRLALGRWLRAANASQARSWTARQTSTRARLHTTSGNGGLGPLDGKNKGSAGSSKALPQAVGQHASSKWTRLVQRISKKLPLGGDRLPPAQQSQPQRQRHPQQQCQQCWMQTRGRCWLRAVGQLLRLDLLHGTDEIWHRHSPGRLCGSCSP